MPYAVAVDIGGTFTDLVAYDHDTHDVVYTKSPTTYDNFVAGILDCFGARIFSGHEMPRSKPFPDVYLAAAAGLGVEPARCAVIEDTVTGATAGVAAGATVFGYCPTHLGHSSATALHGAGAVHVFREMAELPELLAGWVNR